MASTASEALGLELQQQGENDNLWGEVANRNFQALERAISGYTDVAIAGATTTLTRTTFALGAWQNMGLRFTGTLTADSVVVVPTYDKMYFCENATTGAFTLTVKTAAGTGIAIPTGQKALLMCDGTNVVGIVLQPYSGSSGTLAVSAGGTGATTAAQALTNLGAASAASVALKLDASGGTATSLLLKNPRVSTYVPTLSVPGATVTLDLSVASVFVGTFLANTTLALSNVPPVSNSCVVVLILSNAGAYTVTWPSGIRWASGTAPALTASGTDIITLTTTNGGTNWYGVLSAKDVK